MQPQLPNMLFHLRTVELPDTTQTEAELRRDELKSMLEEWTDAPDARHFDFATDHLVYGKKHRSVVIPDGKDWVVIACHICKKLSASVICGEPILILLQVEQTVPRRAKNSSMVPRASAITSSKHTN